MEDWTSGTVFASERIPIISSAVAVHEETHEQAPPVIERR